VQVVEVAFQQRFYRGQAVLDRQVLRHVARAVVVGERQAGAALEHERAHQHALQVRPGAARTRQHELDQALALESGAHFGEELRLRSRRWSGGIGRHRGGAGGVGRSHSVTDETQARSAAAASPRLQRR
jgi:hypothetical protein